MLKKLTKNFFHLIFFVFLFMGVFLFKNVYQTYTANDAWENMTNEKYQIWKNSIATSNDNNVSGDQIQLFTVSSNLFGNEFLEVNIADDGRFTMGTTGGNPDTNRDDNTKLLYGHPTPGTSFTTVKIDGVNYVFKADSAPIIDSTGTESVSTMTKDGVVVKQIIKLWNNPTTNKKDIFRVEYQMINKSSSSKAMGARIMMDTMLGNNDGSPFKIPGVGDVVREVEFTGDSVPKQWQSFDNLTAPNVIASGILYNNISDRPNKVQFCAWPAIFGTVWDYTTSGRTVTGDSAVAIYYEPKTYLPNQSRTIATYYGLSDFAQSDLAPPLSIRVLATNKMEVDSINGDYLSNPFDVSVFVKNTGTATARNVNLSISLPTDLKLATGQQTINLGNLNVNEEKQYTFSVKATLQNTAKNVNYKVSVNADNDSGKVVNMALELPKVNGANKLPVVILHGVFGSTAGVNLLNREIDTTVPHLPRQMPANQEDLKMFDYNDLPGLSAGDTGYNDLKEDLIKLDYLAYTCAYDWRLSLKDIIANNYLQNVIDQAKRESGQDKVILICHSMGGLVARQYIQSDLYRDDVDTLLMIGTPNNGSAFTYSIFEGGEVIDDEGHLIDNYESKDATVKIISNLYKTMVARNTKITSQHIFDFVYKDKKVPSVYTLGAQYDNLLYWHEDRKSNNPLINKAGFESEIAKLNDDNLSLHYQPLSGKSKNKVRTAIFYNTDLETMETLWAKPSFGQGSRYPDGAIYYFYYNSTRREPYIGTNIGDGTVVGHSAKFGADNGKTWTEVPLKFGDKGLHARMVNEVDVLLRNFIFTKDKIKIDATTINEMKTAANSGRSKRSKETSTENTIEPYLFVNVISKANVDMTKNNSIVGEISKYGDDQSIIYLSKPEEGIYNINLAASQLQHAYFIIEYFNGEELYSTSTEVALNNNKSVEFSISSNSLVTPDTSTSLTGGEGLGNNTQLTWDAIPNAVSYNIYSRDIDTDNVSLIGNTDQTTYQTDINWGSTPSVYIYVEPVFVDGTTGILMMSVPNAYYAQADFNIADISGTNPLRVSFADTSIGNPTSWYWDFGDGETSTDQNPTHVYNSEGYYSVSLKINGVSGNDLIIKSNYIYVGNQIESLKLTVDPNVVVGNDVNYSISASYLDGSTSQITSDYEIISSDDDILSVNGTTITAKKYGSAVINVVYNGAMTSEIVNVTDSVSSVTLTEEEIKVASGTLLSDIKLPLANVTYASGNTSIEPVLWYENTEPIYSPSVLEDTKYTITGIVDINNDLLPNNAEPLKVSYTINLAMTPGRSKLTLKSGSGGTIITGNDGEFAGGINLTLEARANSGYRFKYWSSSNGGEFTNVNYQNTIFTMPNNDTTVTANFEYIGSSNTGDEYVPSNNGSNSNKQSPNTSTPSNSQTQNYDEQISAQLNNKLSPVIVIERDVVLSLSGKALISIMSNNKDLRITNGIASLILTSENISEMKLKENDKVDIKINLAVVSLNDNIINIHAVNTSLEKYFYNIDLAINKRQLSNLASMFLIEFNMSNFNLNNDQKEKTTGIRYLNVNGVNQLGGKYTTSNVFQFKTPKLGVYGVLLSNKITKIITAINNNTYILNGKTMFTDIAPTIVENRTMVPIRFIAESMGATVDWDATKKMVIIKLDNGKIISMIVGQSNNDMDVPPVLINNRTLVPLRYIAEQFESNVIWNNKDQSIEIYK